MAGPMPLNLYRRHRQECEGEHPEESRSGEFEERSKKWKRCGCMIFAAGTLGGKFRRRRTGKHTWEEAKIVATAWEETGKWDGAAPVNTPPEKPAGGPRSRLRSRRFWMSTRLGGRHAAQVRVPDGQGHAVLLSQGLHSDQAVGSGGCPRVPRHLEGRHPDRQPGHEHHPVLLRALPLQ